MNPMDFLFHISHPFIIQIKVKVTEEKKLTLSGQTPQKNNLLGRMGKSTLEILPSPPSPSPFKILHPFKTPFSFSISKLFSPSILFSPRGTESPLNTFLTFSSSAVRNLGTTLSTRSQKTNQGKNLLFLLFFQVINSSASKNLYYDETRKNGWSQLQRFSRGNSSRKVLINEHTLAARVFSFPFLFLISSQIPTRKTLFFRPMCNIVQLQPVQ